MSKELVGQKTLGCPGRNGKCLLLLLGTVGMGWTNCSQFGFWLMGVEFSQSSKTVVGQRCRLTQILHCKQESCGVTTYRHTRWQQLTCGSWQVETQKLVLLWAELRTWKAPYERGWGGWYYFFTIFWVINIPNSLYQTLSSGNLTVCYERSHLLISKFG